MFALFAQFSDLSCFTEHLFYKNYFAQTFKHYSKEVIVTVKGEKPKKKSKEMASVSAILRSIAYFTSLTCNCVFCAVDLLNIIASKMRAIRIHLSTG